MWTPDKIKAKPRQMDFTSSGQSIVDVTSIYADEELLVNACELIDLGKEAYQFIVCSHCGYAQCERGNWLTIGTVLDQVFFYPSFIDMEEGEWESSEYTPHYFTRTKGSMCLLNNAYAEIRKYLAGLPAAEKLKPVTSYEIARILQWEASYRVLGNHPDPVLFNDRLFVTSSSENDQESLSEFQAVLKNLVESNEHNFVPLTPEMEKISFFLEASDFIEWVPMVKHGSNYGIILNDSIGVFTQKNS